jgi:hypothetical protein
MASPTIPCARGQISLLKNKYQDTPGDKGGWCVRLTTYHLQVLMSWNLKAEPSGYHRPVMGMLYLLLITLTFLKCFEI